MELMDNRPGNPDVRSQADRSCRNSEGPQEKRFRRGQLRRIERGACALDALAADSFMEQHFYLVPQRCWLRQHPTLCDEVYNFELTCIWRCGCGQAQDAALLHWSGKRTEPFLRDAATFSVTKEIAVKFRAADLEAFVFLRIGEWASVVIELGYLDAEGGGTGRLSTPKGVPVDVVETSVGRPVDFFSIGRVDYCSDSLIAI